MCAMILIAKIAFKKRYMMTYILWSIENSDVFIWAWTILSTQCCFKKYPSNIFAYYIENRFPWKSDLGFYCNDQILNKESVCSNRFIPTANETFQKYDVEVWKILVSLWRKLCALNKHYIRLSLWWCVVICKYSTNLKLKGVDKILDDIVNLHEAYQFLIKKYWLV